MTEKIYIGWDEFHNDVKRLCAEIKKSGSYHKIVAVSRGGLLPAGIAAYELDIRQTETVNVATYVEGKHLSLDEIKTAKAIGNMDEKTLVIDDLVDSGQTFRVMRRQFPLAKYAAVYSKPQGKNEADFFARELADKWVVFPWDVE